MNTHSFVIMNRQMRIDFYLLFLFSSYGYHSDDGNVFHNRGDLGIPFGPKYITNKHTTYMLFVVLCSIVLFVH
jgi:hypothetical protein